MRNFVTITITTSPYSEHTVSIRCSHIQFTVILSGDRPDMHAIMAKMHRPHLHAFLRELSTIDTDVLAAWVCARPDWYTYAAHIGYCEYYNEPTFLQMVHFDRAGVAAGVDTHHKMCRHTHHVATVVELGQFA
jgi:hypothetical protein